MSESRRLDWIFYWYVCPDAVRRVIQELETMNGGIIGLVGLQGVGNSSKPSQSISRTRGTPP
ncbi:MAG: hypothetical protein WCC94_09580 [Candidatus Bathyarchaeia archaeon]